MSVILSMKTFRALEEKLGTDAAKEVYELAEAIYQEVEKRTDEKISKQKLNIVDDEQIKKQDLTAFRKDYSAQNMAIKEELVKLMKETVHNNEKSFRTIFWALALNMLSLIGVALIILTLVFNVQLPNL